MLGIFPWRKACARLALTAVLVANLAHAGTPHLVLDVNPVTEPLSSEPYALGQLGNVELFRATLSIPEIPRTALVKSDGTAAGTVVLKTFEGKGPQGMMVIGSRAFFVAAETATGSQVWVTDGTAAGTQQATNFPPPSASVPPTQIDPPTLLAAFGNDVLFTLRPGPKSEYQLYRTDGTKTGTVLLGQLGLTPPRFDVAVVGNRVYFASFSDTGTELWASDGTAAGAKKLLIAGALGTNPTISLLRPVHSGVVFLTSSSATGQELARIDPTTDAISLLDLAPGTYSGVLSTSTLPAVNGYVYFAGTQGQNDDYELWRSDGTLAGTTRVKDINAGPASSFAPSPEIVTVGDRVIFVADDGAGSRLWGSDGTAAGTAMLLNSSLTFQYGLAGMNLGVIETTRYRYVPARAGIDFVRVVTDGSPAGTFFLPSTLPNGDYISLRRAAGDATAEYIGVVSQNLATSVETYHALKLTAPGQFTSIASSSDPAGISSFVYVGGKLLFDAYDDTGGQELWVLDSAGKRQVVDLTPRSYTGNSNPQWLTDWNGKLAFSADDGAHGAELWISDGTSAGTKLLADINSGYASSDPQQLHVWNGALYFFANNGSFRFMRLASPDGTPEVLGTLDPPERLDNGGALAAVRCLLSTPAAMGGRLYFAAKALPWGTELWSTDGTAAGTAIVANINMGVSGTTPLGSLPCYLTAFKNKVYFTADTSLSGIEATALWSSDGTQAGTSMLFARATTPPLVFNDALYFRGFDEASQTSLAWKSDGTAAGTTSIGPVGRPYGIVNGKLLLLNQIVATPPAQSTLDLWASDGTTAGGARLAESVGNPIVLPKRVYFSKAVSGTQELWSSDGTVPGTQRVRALEAAATYSAVDLGGVTILMITDSSGRTMWRTDGTEAGTTQLGATAARSTADLGPGPIAVGKNVFYAGLDGSIGNELYAVTADDPPPPGSGGGNNGGGTAGGSSSGDGNGGGGGPLRGYDLLALGALLSWRFVRNSRQSAELGKNLSPAVHNL